MFLKIEDSDWSEVCPVCLTQARVASNKYFTLILSPSPLKA